MVKKKIEELEKEIKLIVNSINCIYTEPEGINDFLNSGD